MPTPWFHQVSGCQNSSLNLELIIQHFIKNDPGIKKYAKLNHGGCLRTYWLPTEYQPKCIINIDIVWTIVQLLCIPHSDPCGTELSPRAEHYGNYNFGIRNSSPPTIRTFAFYRKEVLWSSTTVISELCICFASEVRPFKKSGVLRQMLSWGLLVLSSKNRPLNKRGRLSLLSAFFSKTIPKLLSMFSLGFK
jgi:hypothetical protein